MIYRWDLANGAKLIAEDIPYVKSAAVGIYVKVGSRYETPPLAGASHLIEHMLFKGTSDRTAREIAESMEGMGGQLNAYTAKEHTCFYARVLDEDIYTAIDILFDMMFNSRLAPGDIDVERQVIIEEINMYEDAPDELIHDIFARRFWEGHNLGNPVLGTSESIGGMDREAIHQYYRQYYVPGNMIISVGGNIEPLRIKDHIEDKLGRSGGTAPFDAWEPPPINRPFIHLLPKDVEQLQVCLGVPGFSYHDEDRYTQNIMNSILGGGMSSRLFQKLREELGLAYSVYSYPSSYSDTGMFSIYIGTSPAHIDKFCYNLHEQIERFVQQGVTDEEVGRTQRLMKSSISLGLESVMGRMSRLGKAVMMYDAIMTTDEIINRVYAVDAAMVQNMARKLFESNAFSIAIIGNEEVLPEVERELSRWWGGRS